MSVRLFFFLFYFLITSASFGQEGSMPGPSGKSGTAQLDIYESDNGHARVSIVDNDMLMLSKGSDRWGGGCHITIGLKETFGRKQGVWTNANVDFLGEERLVIKDAEGNEVFVEFVSCVDGELEEGNPWPEAEKAAQLAWDLAPDGWIEVGPPGYVYEKASLFGFRELWNWGVQRCEFPPLTD